MNEESSDKGEKQLISTQRPTVCESRHFGRYQQSGTLSRIFSGTRPSVQTVSDACL